MSLGTSSNAIHTYASSLLLTAKIRRISETTIKRKEISVKRFRNTRKRLNLTNDSARIAVCQRVSRNILRPCTSVVPLPIPCHSWHHTACPIYIFPFLSSLPLSSKSYVNIHFRQNYTFLILIKRKEGGTSLSGSLA